jgi:uncharacterized protein (TIGR03067 family)
VGPILGFAPAPVFKKRPLDPDRLEGTWDVTLYDQCGQSHLSSGLAYTVEIEKDQLTFFWSQNGGPLERSPSFTLRLDPKATPAEIDFIQDGMNIYSGVYCSKAGRLEIVYQATSDRTKYRAKDLGHPAPTNYHMRLERRP